MQKKILTIFFSVAIIASLWTVAGCTKNEIITSEPQSEIVSEIAEEISEIVEEPSEMVVEEKKEDIDYLVLVNKENKLPDDWEEKISLTEVENKYGETYLVEDKTLKAFLGLQEALAKESIIIEIDSATRSVARQQEIWDEFTEEKGEEYTKKYVAVPGYSEHHTGLVIDICIEKDGERINDNDDMIAEKEIFEKIHSKLSDYGFILRYLEGKEDITGYGYEPWHFRYIGDTEIAKYIMDNNLTLEEYLQSK